MWRINNHSLTIPLMPDVFSFFLILPYRSYRTFTRRINFQNTTIARHFMPLPTLDVTCTLLRRKNNARRFERTRLRFVQKLQHLAIWHNGRICNRSQSVTSVLYFSVYLHESSAFWITNRTRSQYISNISNSAKFTCYLNERTIDYLW